MALFPCYLSLGELSDEYSLFKNNFAYEEVYILLHQLKPRISCSWHMYTSLLNKAPT